VGFGEVDGVDWEEGSIVGEDGAKTKENPGSRPPEASVSRLLFLEEKEKRLRMRWATPIFLEAQHRFDQLIAISLDGSVDTSVDFSSAP
jgi:hypothetical protein